MGIGNYLIEAYFYIYFYINEFQRELYVYLYAS